jgi:hypothetical protein
MYGGGEEEDVTENKGVVEEEFKVGAVNGELQGSERDCATPEKEYLRAVLASLV